MDDKKQINVVFLGGSITQGASASAYQNAWTARVGEYLKQIYNGKAVYFHNAGVGGTGSVLGVFRLKKDVIARNPDIVFVEYAVNDKDDPAEVSQICMEGIVRQLLRQPKVPVILYVYVPDSTKSAVGASVHQKIADYYHIPSIDLQEYIWGEIGKGKYKWEDIGKDPVHPNDVGHKVYADCVIRTIDRDKSRYLRKPENREKPIMDYEFKNPGLVSYSEAKYTGAWKEERLPFDGRIELAASSCNPGDTVELEFHGKCIGLYHISSRDAGIAEITIDNGAEFKVDMYKNMDVPYCLLRKIDLEDKPHKLKIKVSEQHNPASMGSFICIGYFLVD